VIGQFLFSETTPAAASTVASSQPVTGDNANYLPAGVAGPLDDWEGVDVIAEITGATGGTLNVYLQGTSDGGTSWYDMIAWPQAAAGAAAKYYKSPLSLATTTSVPIQVGKNLVPALTGTVTVVNGAWTDRVRLIFVAGSGTSAGAVVVVRLAPQRARVREHGE
jgi:hypothetical protein